MDWAAVRAGGRHPLGELDPAAFPPGAWQANAGCVAAVLPKGHAHFYVKLGGHSAVAGHGEHGRWRWSLPFLESALLCQADGIFSNATHYYNDD